MTEVIDENILRQDLMAIRDERTPSGITAKRMGKTLLQMLDYSTQQGKVVKRGALFSAEEDLLQTYPSPEVGDYAYVGTVPNTIIYRCTENGKWTKTTETWNGGDVDISGYVLETSLMQYDCSKGGETTFGTLADAIEAVPSDYRKGGLTIFFVMDGDTALQRYTLKSAAWSNDVAQWQNETHLLAQGEGDATDMGISQSAFTEGMKTARGDVQTAIGNVRETISETKNGIEEDIEKARRQAVESAKQLDDEIGKRIDELVIPKIAYMTQAEYDALETKDPNTTYLTTEE